MIVVEKAFAVGAGGIVGQNIRLALSGLPVPVYDVVAGLGGRAITQALAPRPRRRCARRAGRAEPAAPSSTWITASSSASCSRQKYERRSGPHAENLLRDLGVVRAGAH